MSTMTSPLFGSDNSAPSTSVANYNRINATYPASWTGTEGFRATPIGGALTLSNFYMLLDVAPGAGTSYTFTVMKNGSATALTVTISDAATTATDSTHSVSFAAGDTVSIQSQPTGAVATTNLQSWNFLVTTTTLTAPILSSMS